MNKICKITSVLFASLFMLSISAWAEPTPERLAQAMETEKYATETASEKATPELVVEKVEKAAKVLESEGFDAGKEKLQGKGSEFIFAGTYITIHTMENGIAFHPLKPGLEGQDLTALKDIKGRSFIGRMTKVAREKGSGWVSYYWPKPGEREASQKISYVKAITVEGTQYMLSCGIYGFTPEQVAALETEI